MTPWLPSALVNHLWQSTLFMLVVWLATLALRSNGARVRCWLWTAASVKFLVPLSVLVSLGQRFEWRDAIGISSRSEMPVRPYAKAAARRLGN